MPAELAALVAKMMAKDPARRFQTPGEVAQALTPFFKKGCPRDQDGFAGGGLPAVARAAAAAVGVAGGGCRCVRCLDSSAALVLRVKTPEGDLVFSDLPEQSVVTVDGKVYTVEWPGGKGPAKVTVPAGDHRVKVELNGVEVYGDRGEHRDGKEEMDHCAP